MLKERIYTVETVTPDEVYATWNQNEPGYIFRGLALNPAVSLKPGDKFVAVWLKSQSGAFWYIDRLTI